MVTSKKTPISTSATTIRTGSCSVSPTSSKLSPATRSRLVGIALLSLLLLARPVAAQGDPVPAAPAASAVPYYSSASATVATTTSMNVLDDSRKLGRGDQVSFRVVEDRDPPISLVITDSGEMEVPYIGRVKAEGRTCKQLATGIKDALQVDYYYRATVIIGLDRISVESKGRIYVSGEVVTKGPIELPANETLTASNAVTRAGGFGRFADKKNIRILRKNPDGTTRTIIFDYVRVIEKGHTEEDVVLQKGDIINVPAKVINI